MLTWNASNQHSTISPEFIKDRFNTSFIDHIWPLSYFRIDYNLYPNNIYQNPIIGVISMQWEGQKSIADSPWDLKNNSKSVNSVYKLCKFCI